MPYSSPHLNGGPGQDTQRYRSSLITSAAGPRPLQDFAFTTAGATPPGFDNQHQHCFAHAFGDMPLHCTEPQDAPRSGERHQGIYLATELVGTSVFLFVAYLACQVARIGTDSIEGSRRDLSDSLCTAFAFGASYAACLGLFRRRTTGLFNPIMTLTFLCTRTMEPMRALCLTLAQFAGSLIAAGVVKGLIPGHSSLAAESGLINGMSILQGFWLEVLVTFFLSSALLSLSKHRLLNHSLGIPAMMGLVLFIAEMTTLPYTGGGLNPFRSFAPAAVDQNFPEYHWIYWIGPILGAFLSAAGYWFARAIQGNTSGDFSACYNACYMSPSVGDKCNYVSNKPHSYHTTQQPSQLGRPVISPGHVSSTDSPPKPSGGLHREPFLPFNNLRPPPLAVAPPNRPQRSPGDLAATRGEGSQHEIDRDMWTETRLLRSAQRALSSTSDHKKSPTITEPQSSHQVNRAATRNQSQSIRSMVPSLWVRSIPRSPLDLAAILDAQGRPVSGASPNQPSEDKLSLEGSSSPPGSQQEETNQLHLQHRSAPEPRSDQQGEAFAAYMRPTMEQHSPTGYASSDRKRKRHEPAPLILETEPTSCKVSSERSSVSPILLASDSSTADEKDYELPWPGQEFIEKGYSTQNVMAEDRSGGERRLVGSAPSKPAMGPAPPSSWGQNKRSTVRSSQRAKHRLESTKKEVDFNLASHQR